MSKVLSIRIPKELKEEIDELKDFIDIKSEVIQFLKERVKTYKRLKILKEVHNTLKEHPTPPEDIAARMAREDRNSH